MDSLHHELGLAGTLLLNSVVFITGLRFSRRCGTRSVSQTICDAFLIYFVVQYAAVALPASMGVLNLASMSLTAAVACMVLIYLQRRSEPPRGEKWTSDHAGFAVATVFTISYIFVYAWDQRWLPPLLTDALVYHLPTAVRWIQSGKLELFPTWYWNPAATYSPATSSTFMAWLMLPVRSDVFVRFVQVPPLLFVFFLMVRLCRVLGTGRTVAGLIGMAAALSRPMFSEVVSPKDDLFLTAFFAAAMLALNRDSLIDRLGPWRVGLTLGMVLAGKCTILMACPLFLFLIDAPVRAGWRPRHWVIATSICAMMFAPWYIRTLVLTGNPLYPVDVKLFGFTVFKGLFSVERDRQLRSIAGVWKMLAATYHSLPSSLLVLLAGGWLAAAVTESRRIVREPLLRTVLLGAPLMLVVVALVSPHHEVRYIFPLLPAIFVAAGVAATRFGRPPWMPVALAGGLAMVALATSFGPGLTGRIGELASVALLMTVSLITAAAMQIFLLRLKPTALAGIAAVAVLVGGMIVYVRWAAFVIEYQAKDAQPASAVCFAWANQYPGEAALWIFVRQNIPDDATLAFANTYYVYPFYDPGYQRHIGYAPVRRGLHDFLEMPRLGETVPGDLIVQQMTNVMNTDADRATWLQNLQRLGAQYLVVGHFPYELDIPEQRFAAEDPKRFEKVFDDPAGTVYRLR